MAARDTAEFSEVLAAVRAYAAGVTFGLEAPAMRNDIARELHTDIRMQSASDRLLSQIRRALNNMSVAGELVKESDGNSAAYYTPEAAAWRRGEKARREVEDQAYLARTRALFTRIKALGLAGAHYSDNYGRIVLDLPMLEALTELAERNSGERA